MSSPPIQPVLVRRAGLYERVGSAIFALGLLGVLATAAFLDPDSKGHGTHEQLGMPACGWVTAFDKPCMTCGMTTAFSHAADMDLATSFLTQPMGALFAVLAAALIWPLAHIAVTGSTLLEDLSGLARPKAVWGGFVLLLAAWAYKVATWNSPV
ncbi:MAG: DUF2752 domain-containing protein [Planctomycetota bacterium]